MQKIRGHLDLFSGIGGFSLGLKNTGMEPEWLGFSDIDKYANELFKRRFPNAEQLGSVTDVSYESLGGRPIDLLTGGFPCQAFSLAGKRKGFSDTRGTLFFEIERILRDYITHKKPISRILLENVKGLLNHDDGRTFATIYRILSDLDYTIECQLVNTRWWLPQNRERIYIFGRYNGDPSGRKIFPVRNSDKGNPKIKLYREETSRQEQGVQDLKGGGRHSLCGDGYKIIDKKGNKKNNQTYASCLSGGGHSGGNHSDMDLIKVEGIGSTQKNAGKMENTSPTTTSSVGNVPMVKSTALRTFPRTGPDEDKIKRLEKRDDNVANCLLGGDTTASMLDIDNGVSIRRLTPIECERLQGFPDNWTDGQSDTQRYKQCGNAVSVCVTQAIFEKVYKTKEII